MTIVQSINNPLQNIVLRLSHTYELPQGGTRTLLLDERTIPEPEKSFEYSFMNPRYLENLEIEIEAQYAQNTEVLTIPVLELDELDDFDLPSNPVREGGSYTQDEPEFEENRPFDPDPATTIIQHGDISSVVFDTKHNALDILRQAEREENGLYSEEATENFVLNPEFLENLAGYHIEAPGFTQSLKYYSAGQGILRATATNTSLVNAFADVEIKSDLFALTTGAGYMTLSTYYRQVTDREPEGVELKIYYYNNQQQLINSTKKTFLYNPKKEFSRVEYTVSNTPSATAYVAWSIVFKTLTDMVPFTVELTKPQLEFNSRATTWTATSRLADAYRTEAIDWKTPLYMSLETIHTNLGLKGLVDTTVSSKDGFRWMVSNDRLQFRILDENGQTILNVMSNPLNVADFTQTLYGIFIERDTISFYRNNTLISSHPVTYPQFEYNGTAFVGRLEPSGAALNSEIIAFGVYRSKP